MGKVVVDGSAVEELRAALYQIVHPDTPFDKGFWPCEQTNATLDELVHDALVGIPLRELLSELDDQLVEYMALRSAMVRARRKLWRLIRLCKYSEVHGVETRGIRGTILIEVR